MAFRNFDTNVSIRVMALFTCTLILVWLLVNTNYYVAIAFTFGLSALQLYGLLRYVKTTHRELNRFMGAVQNADFSQSFSYKDLGSSYTDLGEAFSSVFDQFRVARTEREEQAHYLRMLVDHIPVALITIHDDGKVEALNNAARRMFTPGFPRSPAEFERFGTELPETISNILPGENVVVRTDVAASNRQLKISATEIIIGGEKLKILSLQDIQSELDATEFDAWRELGRVLTHELMNSLTPVSSLAGTATNMLSDLKEEIEADSPLGQDIDDIHSAVEAVARRSQGLLNFVENYRQVMRVPPPEIVQFQVSDVFDRLDRLMRSDLEERGIALTCSVVPKDVQMRADPDLLEQALINLIRNARDAIATSGQKEIEVKARVNTRNRIEISVKDTGGGISPDVAGKIFVPFFTTKESGAGIGLSFSRQIMLAHRGTIDLDTEEGVGTTIFLRFQ
jgi:signal transduction histidine kinase